MKIVKLEQYSREGKVKTVTSITVSKTEITIQPKENDRWEGKLGSGSVSFQQKKERKNMKMNLVE